MLMTACGGKNNGDVYHNIAAKSNPYSMGTQDITIESSSLNPDQPEAKFKESISASDIELGQALVGKTVTKVVYNSETSITVTLDGNTTANGGNDVYGTITVKQSGMKSKGSSSCTVNVLAPVIMVSGDYFSGGGLNNFLIMANIKLTAGNFTSDATAENITFADGVTGNITVTVSNGMLALEIKNCTVKNPTIVLKPQVTSFGKEYTLKLAPYASTLI